MAALDQMFPLSLSVNMSAPVNVLGVFMLFMSNIMLRIHIYNCEMVGASSSVGEKITADLFT